MSDDLVARATKAVIPILSRAGFSDVPRTVIEDMARDVVLAVVALIPPPGSSKLRERDR